MFSGQGSVVVGYRWITFGGENACKQCAALNGREFYLNPGPGQASVSDMPHPPLHPNCGCKLMEIIDVARVAGRRGETEGEQDLEAADGQPGEEDGEEKQPEVFVDGIVGLSWRDGHITSGPIYGKFCGKNWTYGQHVYRNNYTQDDKIKAEDDLDTACFNHDKKYTDEKYAEADRELVQALAALPEDPRMWPNRPPEHKIEEAKRYRKWALRYFRGAVANRERPARDEYEWGDANEGDSQ